ncbi:MAG TPA: type II toxin-antitoxin system death-on-curing family toxin [Chthoniobacter sp.]|nr:type II toxin-antitoxin system death-on-curing family toxin [Chthoniobacter sp.]
MSEPVFISVAQVEIIHARQIARFGGTPGIRDRGGMESAVFQPQNIYFYANGDLYEVAAGYAYHIAEAQAFLDGNKRTAMGAALAFLQSNRIETHTATAELYEAMIAIAEKRMSRADLAALLRELFAA